jgi:hypothetical protein
LIVKPIDFWVTFKVIEVMLDDVTIARFEKALSELSEGFSSYRNLAHQMATEGMSQPDIFNAFRLFGQRLCDNGRDPFEYFSVFRSMECIAGWCARDKWWFDRNLTRAEVDFTKAF